MKLAFNTCFLFYQNFSPFTISIILKILQFPHHFDNDSQYFQIQLDDRLYLTFVNFD